MATIETHPVIHEETTDARERHVRTKRTLGGVGIETFTAVGALVLAIIALAGLYADQLGAIAAVTASITLALVAFLALGASLVLGSAAIGGRLASSLRA